MQGRVVSLRRKLERGHSLAEDCLNLVAGGGIEGDIYFGSETRQLLLLDTRTLSEFNYSPGDLREQILVDFESLQSLPSGHRLQVGEALVEITDDCAPCRHMAQTLGEDGEQFVRKMMGKRGMLAIVVESGTVKPNDVVRSLET